MNVAEARAKPASDDVPTCSGRRSSLSWLMVPESTAKARLGVDRHQRTMTGEARWVFVPSPSWPLALFPQQYTLV